MGGQVVAGELHWGMGQATWIYR